jgi:hypothetical protein
MKYIILLLGILVATAAFAASGDRVTAILAKYSSATGSMTGTCTKGSIRVSRTQVFFCTSTATSTYGRWKKTTIAY